MVQLEEVRDEEFTKPQSGPKLEDEEDDWDTDSESETSSISTASELQDESLLDRLSALRDIIPPTYRTKLTTATSQGYSYASFAARLTGKTLWVVCASTLLVGLPWALAFSEEQQVVEMEREMRMQQSASELLTRGAGETDARPAV